LFTVDLVEIDVHVVEEGAPLYLSELLHAFDQYLTRCNLAVALDVLVVAVEVQQETLSIQLAMRKTKDTAVGADLVLKYKVANENELLHD
jgi:hypothetical protein